MTAALRTSKGGISSSRLSMMANHLANGSNGVHSGGRYSLRDIPKSNVFTTQMPADPLYPTPHASHKALRADLGPRGVKDALYTFVRPAEVTEPELVDVSERAMKDLGLKEGEEKTQEFKDTVSGNKILTWNEEDGGIYPWAQCYGGWQFGSWASQLGDGRAISLFEMTNPDTNVRYELQLKGAGKTPYSRFADGKAVVRSSLREYVVSEALNALEIPTTRALALTILPKDEIIRESIEPGAIVARFAQSWLRIGTFDLLRARGYRKIMRQLAEYVATNVFPGWESLPARIPLDEIQESSVEVIDPARNIAASTIEGPFEGHENRFTRLYREICRRNARTVAAWQAYGFMNGVLNTDNTSIYGLSIDYGPFAFMDDFDPNYTPNHDDHMLRYSYKNQPSIIWWNLVRLGEDMGELLGAGDQCDDETFVEKGVSEDFAQTLIKRATNIIDRANEEYKAVFLSEYKRLMTARLGLKQLKEGDMDNLISSLLDTMESLELDFNQTFRKLSELSVNDIATEDTRSEITKHFLHEEGVTAMSQSLESAQRKWGEWLRKWRERVVEDWGESESSDTERQTAMKKSNPKFVAKGWILDELIQRVEKKGERDVLHRVMNMVLNPFEDSWGGDLEEEKRFCGDPPKYKRGGMCSCSS